MIICLRWGMMSLARKFYVTYSNDDVNLYQKMEDGNKKLVSNNSEKIKKNLMKFSMMRKRLSQKN